MAAQFQCMRNEKIKYRRYFRIFMLFYTGHKAMNKIYMKTKYFRLNHNSKYICMQKTDSQKPQNEYKFIILSMI